MNKIIPLWNGVAPYTAESPKQAQPSIKEFKVEGSRGAVVVCPGGGYKNKAPHEGDPIALMLNEAGISAYVLDYRVYTCNRLAPVNDALRAIRVLRSLGYDKVGILGFSAGGHLACSAATMYDEAMLDESDPIDHFSARPDVLVSCYSVVSFVQYPHIGSRTHLLGDGSRDDQALARRFSVDQNVTRDTPPAFIWHTAEDSSVPVENSLMLASAFAAKGVPFELHIFPRGRHGLGLAESFPDVAQWAPLCQRWLVDQGLGV